jgi:hypothetical protein
MRVKWKVQKEVGELTRAATHIDRTATPHATDGNLNERHPQSPVKFYNVFSKAVLGKTLLDVHKAPTKCTLQDHTDCHTIGQSRRRINNEHQITIEID